MDIYGNVIVKKAVNWPLTVVLSLILPSVVVWFFISKYKGIKLAYDADMYFNKNETVMGNVVDKFLTTHTSRVRIYHSSDGSSGGGSHSSSFGGSHGSSGRSHGGGGRHF